MQITKSSASYWEGKSDAESLQRVYGISFPDAKQLKQWQEFQVRPEYSQKAVQDGRISSNKF